MSLCYGATLLLLTLLALMSCGANASRPPLAEVHEPAAALQVDMSSNHMKIDRKLKAQPEQSQLSASLEASHREASKRAGGLKARLEALDEQLNGKVQTDFDDTVKNADETKNAAREWAHSSQEMHDVALQGWKDATKQAMETMQSDHKELERTIRGSLVFDSHNPRGPKKGEAWERQRFEEVKASHARGLQ